MSAFLRHDATGRIMTVGQCPDGDEHYYEFDGLTLVTDIEADAHRHWYDIAAQQLREREPSGIVVSGSYISGIPVPCELRITGPVALNATLGEPELDLSFDVPGTYTLEFLPEHPRWLPETLTLEIAE